MFICVSSTPHRSQATSAELETLLARARSKLSTAQRNTISSDEACAQLTSKVSYLEEYPRPVGTSAETAHASSDPYTMAKKLLEQDEKIKRCFDCVTGPLCTL